MSTAPTRKLELGRIGEAVKRVDGIPKVTGEFAYSSDLFAAGMPGATRCGRRMRTQASCLDRHLEGGRHGGRPCRPHPRGCSPATSATGSSSPTSPCSRSTGCATGSRSPSSPPSIRAGAAGGGRDRGRVRTARARGRSRACGRPGRDPPAALDGGARLPRRPAAQRRGGHADRPGDPDAEGEVSVEGYYELGIQDQAFLARSRDWPFRTARVASTSTSRPSGCTSIATRWRPAWASRSRCELPRRRGRPSGAGHLDADPRRDARAAHRLAREDGLQPRGVVLRPCAPAPGPDLGRAPREPGREARERPDADPARRRCVRVQLDRRDSNAASFAVGPYAIENALIESTCVYIEQPDAAGRCVVRRRPDLFAAEAQMDKLAAALEMDPVEPRLVERDGARRRPADGAEDHRVDAGRGGDPQSGCHPGPGRGGAPSRSDPAPRRRGEHDAG